MKYILSEFTIFIVMIAICPTFGAQIQGRGHVEVKGSEGF